MKIFLHVLFTWLLAVLLGFAGIWLVNLGRYTHFSLGNLFDTQTLVVVVVGYTAALPALILGILFLFYLQATAYTASDKLVLWYLSTLLAVFLNMFIAVMVFNQINILQQVFLELWPVFLAVIIAITIRYKQFMALCAGTVDRLAQEGKIDELPS